MLQVSTDLDHCSSVYVIAEWTWSLLPALSQHDCHRYLRAWLVWRVELGERVPLDERSHVSSVTQNVCVNLNLFRVHSPVPSTPCPPWTPFGSDIGVCSDSSTHHNTGTQIQHLPHIKHTSLSPRSHRRPPNQPHYVNYEIITDKKFYLLSCRHQPVVSLF